jgi:hypothetical protein
MYAERCVCGCSRRSFDERREGAKGEKDLSRLGELLHHRKVESRCKMLETRKGKSKSTTSLEVCMLFGYYLVPKGKFGNIEE